ncbi:armadillo repeat-containing protein 6 isoform X2 [Lepeophtheirus salmonis]|uniref:armadillo repeat-containing protein 6 isoform X2 n=1 Tax=Lepeophtheirus salmonis TaxID=72036 RepID=UPI003AF3D43E
MVKVISQDTFDAVVAENMDEFDMSKSEAIEEAKEQFLSQGVDLSNIVIFEGEGNELKEMIESLESLQLDFDDEKAKSQVLTFKSFLDKGLAEKTLATSCGGYNALVQLLSNASSSKEKILHAMTSLVDGNPDPLTEEGLESVKQAIHTGDTAIRKAGLDFLLNVCVRHEYNRQNVIRSGILNEAGKFFNDAPIEVARLWQALVQDDDVRVPYGKAHDNARQIVEDYDALTLLNNKLKDLTEPKDISLLLCCLSSLSVRNEYCKKVADDGGLNIILKVLVDPDQDKNVIKESLKLVKTLAGNDDVKRDIGNTKGIPFIVNSISKNLKNKSICQVGCDSLTALSLRSPENAKQIVDCGGDGVIIEIMKAHKSIAEIVPRPHGAGSFGRVDLVRIQLCRCVDCSLLCYS